MSLHLRLTLALWAGIIAACQTPAAPSVPAASADVAGPAPAPSVLQRATGGALLFPAKGGQGGHHHHHKAPPPESPPADGAGADAGPEAP